MAKKSGNGHSNGKAADLGDVVAELRRLGEGLALLQVTTAEGFAKSNARLERLEEVSLDNRRGLREVREELANVRGEVHEGFADLGQKIVSAAERDSRLEGYVRALAERVARLESARTP